MSRELTGIRNLNSLPPLQSNQRCSTPPDLSVAVGLSQALWIHQEQFVDLNPPQAPSPPPSICISDPLTHLLPVCWESKGTTLPGCSPVSNPSNLNEVVAFFKKRKKKKIPLSSEPAPGADTLLCEAEQGAPLPGLPARQTGPPGEGEWGFWIFEGPAGSFGRFFFFFSLVVFLFFQARVSSPRGPLERGREDTMGCCSGRCTLAFICGMQLVS